MAFLTLMRLLLLTVVIVMLAAAALLLLVWWGQERVVFQPPRGTWPEPPGARRLEIDAPDGTRLFAFAAGDLDSLRKGAPLLVHFHGNAEIAAWAVPWAQETARRTGAAVVVAEYRGYAGTAGSPSYRSSREDALALWRHLESRFGATPRHTTLHGFSLGTAVATELASEIRPRALVLEAPFTSARAMAERMGRMISGPLWRMIARVHYDTRARVAQLDAPVWVAHGDRDIIVPFAMGEQVYAAARVKGAFLRVRGAGHNDLRNGAAAGYWNWLGRALD